MSVLKVHFNNIYIKMHLHIYIYIIFYCNLLYAFYILQHELALPKVITVVNVVFYLLACLRLYVKQELDR